MKIEELIIDGFKSYAARTVITGWDSQFNAITGLNGSGKSNILDSICFVLGISSMSTVRASNLQDLIYKRGQAGVTKASVTIVFDNSDKEKSPIGFTDYPKISITRQVVLGGTSKYLINGHRAQQQTVLQLFQSVQLNINNPNFLIMQGKITKVLNMPPAQILSLIAEAAGTKLFEDRREKAVKTMAKKDNKLTEIKNLLMEEIEPKLEKLRKEKKEFLEFQQTQSELDKLSRIVNAHDYLNYSKRYETMTARLNDLSSSISQSTDDCQRLSNEISSLQEDLSNVQRLKDQELQKDGKLSNLESKEKKLSNELVRLNTSKNLKLENLNQENENFKKTEASLRKLKAEYDLDCKNFDILKNNYDASKIQLKDMNEEIVKKEELLVSLQTGVSSKGSTSNNGYLGQLQSSKQKLSDSKIEVEELRLQINNLQNEIQITNPKIPIAEVEIQKFNNEIQNLNDNIQDYEQRLLKIGFDSNLFKQLKTEEHVINQKLYKLNNDLGFLRRKVSYLEFNYEKPTPDFNPDSIKGVAAKLFTLDEKNFDSATALEVSAGGKIFNIVVDNEVTGSQLLEKGRLRKRVTIIPLNKIAARSINPNTVKLAKDLCPGKVELALNLVGFEEEVSKAMEYIFGSVFITKDPNTSKTITFNPNIRARSVTLDGDVYDPSGTLSGGSRRQGGSILLTIQSYNKLSSEIKMLQNDLQEVTLKLQQQEKLSRGTLELQKQTSLAKHSLELLKKKMENSSSYQLIAQQKSNNEKLLKFREDIAIKKKFEEDIMVEISSIEKDMSEFASNKTSKLKELEKDIVESKKTASKLDSDLKVKFDNYQDLQFKVEKTAGDIDAYKEQLNECQQMKNDYEKQIDELNNDINSNTSTLEQLNQNISQQKETLLGINKEFNELTKLINEKSKEMNNKKLIIQKSNHELEKLQATSEKMQAHLQKLVEEHDWVLDKNVLDSIIRQNPNINVNECHGRINNLTTVFQGMKRRVNSNIMSMIDNVEKKETSLKSMIKTIEKDKAKIEETIATLDEYKRETLQKTWQKVSNDFGNIFADLLPGAFAKLLIPEGKDITEGLEIKVMLGKVWKESLVELSGGQRSLAALSLILALLQFKPAPMYILDEVDAALDLSHTQNIGHLIKNRFKGSQFIVVSLKEGMFTNANRVFRTRFQDGTSIVSIM